MEQFDKLRQGSSTGSTAAARHIVETVWKRRDLEADEEIGLQVSDWERLVRPMSEGLSLV